MPIMDEVLDRIGGSGSCDEDSLGFGETPVELKITSTRIA